jgi:DNA-binding IclR family transcriptional regulator
MRDGSILLTSATGLMKPSNSLERILAVLEVFSEQRLEWTVEELMVALGHSRPTMYRYLKTLKDAGLVTYSRSARVTLGPKVVEMDYLVRRSDALVSIGLPHLKQLTEMHPCTAMLLRWYGRKILCVVSETSASRPISSYPRGRPMPLGRGAIPRSIMAFLPRAELVPLVESNLADLSSVGLGSTAEEVMEQLKAQRRSRYFVAFGEVTPGAVGIAAPVFDERQYPIASLCVTIAGSAVSGTTIDTIGAKVHAAASEITGAYAQARPDDDQ